MKVHVHKSVHEEVDTSYHIISSSSSARRGQPDQEIRCQLHLNYIQILIHIKTPEPEFDTHGTLDIERVVTHSLRTYLDLLFQNKVEVGKVIQRYTHSSKQKE